MSNELEMITDLRKQFLQTVRMLAKSQGFYGRLLNDFENATTEEEKATAQSTIDRYQPRVDTYAARVAEYQAKLDLASRYEALNVAVSDDMQDDLLKLYKKIYETAK